MVTLGVDMKTKVAIVTASGGQMGGAIAKALVAQETGVVVNDRIAERTNAIEKELHRLGADVSAVTADVSTREGAKELADAALGRWGRIDVLVNVAGGIKGPILNPIWSISDEQWYVTLNTNLTSAFMTITAVLPTMMNQQSGCIVNTGSTSWAGSPAHSHYAAAKAGLVSLTRSVASQVGPYGIRANVVAPGGTLTLARERPDGHLLDPNTEHVKHIPLRRLNEPEDVANAVMFLVSDAARNISGQVLTIAGGLNPAL
jgi:NAD(P)-dependent dehydrogenase (short-subunit alcohol dehydrogenase family)